MKLATLALTGALLAPAPLGITGTGDTAHALPVVRKIDPRVYVQQRASRSGWRGREWRCLDALVYRESRWHLHSKNRHSSAYGLFQFLHMKPGTPIDKQYQRFESYIGSRYGGSPCNALHFHTQRGYY